MGFVFRFSLLLRPAKGFITTDVPLQTKDKIGFTFATGLRSVLRHDPDIVMVGEIRDFETAEIALRSALTGHLVFSTLHTNNASQTVSRLMDLGIEPYLLADSLQLIIAQRLVRTLCNSCKQKARLSLEEQEKLGVLFPDLSVSDAIFRVSEEGCSDCIMLDLQGEQ